MDSSELVALAYWLLGLVLIAVGTFLVRRYAPLVRAMREYQILNELAWIAVRAAEQLGEKNFWSGEAKKHFARSVIQVALERLGIQVTPDEVDAMIEAAVRELDRLAETE